MVRHKPVVNPKELHISMYKKLDEGVYEIHFDEEITTLTLYKLVKK